MAQNPRVLDADQISRELRAEARAAAALHKPMHEDMNRRLTDEELLARDQMVSAGPFDFPPDIVPDGMVYEWKRVEVAGKPDTRSIAEAERNGWRPVPAKRHPGQWMQRDYEGPVIVESMQLMELPEVEAYNRTRTLYLRAVQQRRAAAEMLGQAPQGTGPRTHPGVRPQVNRTTEALPVE